MQDDDEEVGIPEWVVTFGDMMSLLLTFFIMLVSMSEIKEEEKYQAMVDSMRKQFGHDLSMESVTPGDHKSRSRQFRLLSTESRAKVKDTHKGVLQPKRPMAMKSGYASFVPAVTRLSGLWSSSRAARSKSMRSRELTWIRRCSS